MTKYTFIVELESSETPEFIMAELSVNLRLYFDSVSIEQAEPVENTAMATPSPEHKWKDPSFPLLERASDWISSSTHIKTFSASRMSNALCIPMTLAVDELILPMVQLGLLRQEEVEYCDRHHTRLTAESSCTYCKNTHVLSSGMYTETRYSVIEKEGDNG